MLRPLREVIAAILRRDPPPPGWEEAKMREHIRKENLRNLTDPRRFFLSSVPESARHRKPMDPFFRPQ